MSSFYQLFVCNKLEPKFAKTHTVHCCSPWRKFYNLPSIFHALVTFVTRVELGAFNNYGDQNLPNFDHLPTSRG